MANFDFGVQFQDIFGKKAGTSGHFVAADHAGALAYLQGLLEAMNKPNPSGVGALPVTLGKVIDLSLSEKVDFSGWALTPAALAGSENQKGGRFIFRSNLGTARMTLPTFNEALRLTSGDIDIANPAVFAFYQTAVIAGGAADSHYTDLNLLSEAYLTLGGDDARK